MASRGHTIFSTFLDFDAISVCVCVCVRARARDVCERERERDSEREKGRQRESERYLKRGVYLGRLLPRHLEDHTVTKARTLLPCLLLLEVV